MTSQVVSVMKIFHPPPDSHTNVNFVKPRKLTHVDVVKDASDFVHELWDPGHVSVELARNSMCCTASNGPISLMASQLFDLLTLYFWLQPQTQIGISHRIA